MTISESAQKELQGLIDDLCEGCLSDSQAKRLEQSVCDDAEAARVYSSFMNLHGALILENADSAESLAATLATVRELSSPRPTLLDTLSVTRNYAVSSLVWLRETIDFRYRPLRASLVIATLAMTVWLSVLASLRAPHPRALTSTPLATDTSVARISGMLRCRWAADTEPYTLGAALHVGDRIQLATGIVEIQFRQGAVVRLEGPAVLLIQSDRLSRLRSGKLSARVISRAAGFTVETPTVTVVDQGTEFAVKVPDHGAEEVHVFEGVVEVLLTQGGGHKFLLKQDQAVKIRFPEEQQAAVVEYIPSGRAQFSELLATRMSSRRQPGDDSPERIINTFSDTSSQLAFPARDDDLINVGQPTFDAAASYETGFSKGGQSSVEGLNDGTLGPASVTTPANTWSNDDRDGFSQTFVLDTRKHKDGFDITEIRTIAGWTEGRFAQKYAVSYSAIDEPSRFMLLATVDHNHSNTTGNNSTLVQLLSESGPIASHVKAIRFDFQTGGSTVWREVDVLGSPTKRSKSFSNSSNAN